MPYQVRRVVTGHNSEGKAVFIADGESPRHVSFDNLPGLEFIELWATQGTARIPIGQSDPTVNLSTFVPGPNGTRFRIVRFPPGLDVTKMNESGLDLNAFREEYLLKAPGLAETYEVDNPGMHETDTIDYGIVLSGEIYLELDDGEERHLKAGDCVVQNGTLHGWKNKSEEHCVIAFIMIGAERYRV